VALVEADHARDGGFRAQPARDLLDAPPHRWAANVAGAHDRHDSRVELAVRSRLEAVGGLDRLRRRVVRPVRAHVLRHPEAERGGERRREHRDEQHPAPVGVNERGEVGEHGTSLSGGLWTLSTVGTFVDAVH
jgi:hypothetical protein